MSPTRTRRRAIAHARRTTHRGRPISRVEQGYTLAMTALVLIPMTIFAGLSVDVGSWYARAAEIQRATDAAALAGVVWLPGDFVRAEKEARAIARRNGFVNGANGVTVSVLPVPGRSNELDVKITDTKVPVFLARMVNDEVTITRSARSRYVLPVPLGSPLNTFGNQTVSTADADPDFWAAINSPYTSTQWGDPFNTRCKDNRNATSCDVANPEFRDDGYRYVVDVPDTGVQRTLTVDVFDAPYTNRSNITVETGDYNIEQSARPALSYQLFAPDPTPLDPTDNLPVSGCTAGPTNGTLSYGTTGTVTKNAWSTVCRLTTPKNGGRYILQVKSTVQGAGSSSYSLRATLSGSGKQPSLYAFGEMSILANTKASTAELYLAAVEKNHAGKTFRVELFDAGDGQSGTFYMSILKPDGTIAKCSYGVRGATMSSQQDCRIKTKNAGTGSGNIYNDQWLQIDIKLDATYTCDITTPTGCWWKISYDFGTGEPYDRTTWKASVLGDPVQLIR